MSSHFPLCVNESPCLYCTYIRAQAYVCGRTEVNPFLVNHPSLSGIVCSEETSRGDFRAGETFKMPHEFRDLRSEHQNWRDYEVQITYCIMPILLTLCPILHNQA